MTEKHERGRREETDQSLKGERQKTDNELAGRTRALEENADTVVHTARQRADEVLTRARTHADEKFEQQGATAGEQAIVDAERRHADEALRSERAVADHKLASERAARQRAVAALLAEEREETDDHLAAERKDSDAAIGSRDDFLSIVSHDLRNMLGGISMSASLLTEIPCDDQVHGAIVRDAERIQRYTVRMTRLVGDLVDLASIEAGQLSVIAVRRDAGELLRETQEVFEPIAAARGISLRTEVPRASLLADYDHERILQVLANLVGNAIKFAPSGGRIDIIADQVDHDVRFSVADTGRGIASDRLSVVFERFWQDAKRERRGLGLGLYISKRIIEAHGGKIWAESRHGLGSTFYFTLPAARDRPKVT